MCVLSRRAFGLLSFIVVSVPGLVFEFGNPRMKENAPTCSGRGHYRMGFAGNQWG